MHRNRIAFYILNIPGVFYLFHDARCVLLDTGQMLRSTCIFARGKGGIFSHPLRIFDNSSFEREIKIGLDIDGSC